LKKYVAREGWRGKRLVAINSGANMNFDRLRHVAERADLGGEREALLAVVIPERPGSFLHFCEVLGRRSVTEFNYRYAAADGAQIFVGLALSQGRTEKDAVVQRDRKSTRLNSSHLGISYAVFCLKKKKNKKNYAMESVDKT